MSEPLKRVGPDEFLEIIEARFLAVLDQAEIDAVDEPMRFVDGLAAVVNEAQIEITPAVLNALHGCLARWRAEAVARARLAALGEARALVADGKIDEAIAGAEARVAALVAATPTINVLPGVPGEVH